MIFLIFRRRIPKFRWNNFFCNIQFQFNMNYIAKIMNNLFYTNMFKLIRDFKILKFKNLKKSLDWMIIRMIWINLVSNLSEIYKMLMRIHNLMIFPLLSNLNIKNKKSWFKILLIKIIKIEIFCSRE